MCFAKRIINVNDATIHLDHNHDYDLERFMLSKNMYNGAKNIPNHVLKKIEILQVNNILSLNVARIAEENLWTRGNYPKILIIYFKNAPYIDGEGLRLLIDIVSKVTQKGSFVFVAGADCRLIDILKQKEESSQQGHLYGYLVSHIQDAINKAIKSLGG
jgi:anti-anti-sigma regulatory factor